MTTDPKHTRTFWFIFVPLFVVSSFIPVLPLYMGAAEPILMMVLPIWAIYASVFVMPEWILFSCPVIITHSSVSYLTARRIAEVRRNPIQFSLFSLLSASTLLAIGTSLIVAYADVGFCMFFFACLLTVTVANYRKWDTVAGLLIPKLNRTILIACAAVCAIMLLFGVPIMVARIAG